MYCYSSKQGIPHQAMSYACIQTDDKAIVCVPLCEACAEQWLINGLEPDSLVAFRGHTFGPQPAAG